jgi:hypothetical protein
LPASGDAGLSKLDHNVVIGYQAMDGSGTVGGSDNIFIGRSAGGGAWTLNPPSGNVGIGVNVMDAAMNGGSNNVGIGNAALSGVTTGAANVCIGYRAGYAITTSTSNTFVGYNSGITVTTTTGKNTGIGYGSLSGISTGSFNTAVGYEALKDENTGNKNTAVGYLALQLFDFDGDGNNTAIGYNSGATLLQGVNNTILGSGAFDAATTNADDNVAIGYNAMGGAIAAEAVLDCVTIGSGALAGALEEESSGTVAIGKSALAALTDGAGNTAVGYTAMDGVTTGLRNTVVGYNALGTGDGIETDNTCIGHNAGDGIVQSSGSGGDQMTMIGSGTDPSTAAGSNQTCIGYDCQGIGNNYAVIGDGNTTRLYAADDVGATLYAGSATVETSDKRIKEDIKDSLLGLDFINQLRAIEYKKRQPIDYDESLKKEMNWYKNDRKPRVLDELDKNKLRTGFIAQEVGEVLKNIGFDDNNDIVEIDESNTQQMIAYSKLVPPLVKAIQELTAKVEALENA